MMIIYVPSYGKPFAMAPFDGCFGQGYNYASGSRCNWVVPGTWPAWML